MTQHEGGPTARSGCFWECKIILQKRQSHLWHIDFSCWVEACLVLSEAQAHEHATHVSSQLFFGMEEDIEVPCVQGFRVCLGYLISYVHGCGNCWVFHDL